MSQRLLTFISLLIFSFESQVFSQEYFQQEVNYTIHVTLNDRIHELSASETIEYINNSKDTLSYLYFHLWPNAYSNNKTELANQLFRWNGKEKLFNDIRLQGYIDSLDFKGNNKPLQWSFLPGKPDICILNLNNALKPGDTIFIYTPFHVKLPDGVTSRLGHTGQSYQISQWYPKPAVYDKSGWHQMPYLDQGEFFSEFGDYDVSITLPSNYIVGASGDLQTSAELDFLNKAASDTSWINFAWYQNLDFPPSSEKSKTLRYRGSQIHDFAWFADKRFHVMKSQLKLMPSGKDVTTWAMFTDLQASLWKNAIKYINSSIRHFSSWIGEYPYNTFSAVQGTIGAGDGMEYPGITVIGPVSDAYDLDQVIAHEVCHSWFYSSLGSDERRFPFMDEGITTSYEARYMNERYPDKKLWEVYLKNKKLAKFLHIDKLPVQRMAELQWLIQARSNLEQPIDLPAPDYTVLNYNDIIYYKAAQGFTYLRTYLGDSLFDLKMHEYFSVWDGKHPQPEDLRKIFESHSDKNLDWFFDDFLSTTKRIDYKIVRLENQRVLLKNNGEMDSPVILAGMTGDSICFEKWIEGFDNEKWIELPESGYSSLRINPNHVMSEINFLNNNIRRSGLFPKSDKVNAQLLFSIEDPDKRSFMYFPAVDWDQEDGLMLGVTVNNGFLLPKSFLYNITPLISLKNLGLTGYGKISYNLIPYNKPVRMASISLNATQFGAPGDQTYLMTKTGVNLYLRNNHMVDEMNQTLFGYFITTSDLLHLEQIEGVKTTAFVQLGYIIEKQGLINPYKLTTLIESNKSYLKTSLEFNYKLSYRGKKSGLQMRFFAGIMAMNNTANSYFDFSATGRDGREEYLYQVNYFDRFSVFPQTALSRQMTISEGGLITPLNDSLGYSRWLISATFDSNLPGKAGIIPVKPFVNILLNDHGFHAGNTSPLFWEAGLKAGLWNFFELYVPLVVSRNISSVRKTLTDRIRFVFNLDYLYNIRLNQR